MDAAATGDQSIQDPTTADDSSAPSSPAAETRQLPPTPPPTPRGPDPAILRRCRAWRAAAQRKHPRGKPAPEPFSAEFLMAMPLPRFWRVPGDLSAKATGYMTLWGVPANNWAPETEDSFRRTDGELGLVASMMRSASICGLDERSSIGAYDD